MIAALLDAFAAADVPRSHLMLPSDSGSADTLAQWAAEHGLEVETVDHENADGRWKTVEVTLPNRSWLCAHREFETVEPATISTPGTEVLL